VAWKLLIGRVIIKPGIREGQEIKSTKVKITAGIIPTRLVVIILQFHKPQRVLLENK
jgi:hypothetical protein